MGFNLNTVGTKTDSKGKGGRYDYDKAVNRGTLTISLSAHRRVGGRSATGAMKQGGNRWQTFGNGGSFAPSIDVIGRSYETMTDLESALVDMGNLPLDDDHATTRKDDAVHGGIDTAWQRWEFGSGDDVVKVTLYDIDETAPIKRVKFVK